MTQRRAVNRTERRHMNQELHLVRLGLELAVSEPRMITTPFPTSERLQSACDAAEAIRSQAGGRK